MSWVPQMKRTEAMPIAVLDDALGGRLFHRGVVGEPEIVVGAEVEHLPAIEPVRCGRFAAK